MNLLFADIVYDINVYVDVLDDWEEWVAGKDQLGGYFLAFGLNIPHIELSEFKGINNWVFFGLTSHLYCSKIQVPARSLT